MDVSPLCHKFVYGSQTVAKGLGAFIMPKTTYYTACNVLVTSNLERYEESLAFVPPPSQTSNHKSIACSVTGAVGQNI